MMSLKVYNVPEYETEQTVQFVGRLNIRSIADSCFAGATCRKRF